MSRYLSEFIAWVTTDSASVCFRLGGLFLLAAIIVIAFLPLVGIGLAIAGLVSGFLASRFVRGASITPEAFDSNETVTRV